MPDIDCSLTIDGVKKSLEPLKPKVVNYYTQPPDSSIQYYFNLCQEPTLVPSSCPSDVGAFTWDFTNQTCSSLGTFASFTLTSGRQSNDDDRVAGSFSFSNGSTCTQNDSNKSLRVKMSCARTADEPVFTTTDNGCQVEIRWDSLEFCPQNNEDKDQAGCEPETSELSKLPAV